MSDDTRSEKIKVRVDAELEDLVPGFLENRAADVASIRGALDADDFDTIRVLGHSMKGSGGGYGFDEITNIGRRIEDASKQHDRATIADATDALERYLARVEIEYVW